jgi:hypothetical protein
MKRVIRAEADQQDDYDDCADDLPDNVEDHHCEECPEWDDINGCWMDGRTSGAQDMACPHFARYWDGGL